MLGPEDVRETLETIIARNVSLVRDVSEQARARIGDAVFRGLTERTPAREVASQVREAVAMSRRRSINIASDQLTKISSSLDSERMQQAGIEQWKWMHSGKLHPREEHKARNGKLYSFSKPPADMPGQLPFCGCRKLAVVELD
jgi:SPP1 gp7 family putative phage head morphogenesis protein